MHSVLVACCHLARCTGEIRSGPAWQCCGGGGAHRRHHVVHVAMSPESLSSLSNSGCVAGGACAPAHTAALWLTTEAVTHTGLRRDIRYAPSRPSRSSRSAAVFPALTQSYHNRAPAAAWRYTTLRCDATALRSYLDPRPTLTPAQTMLRRFAPPLSIAQICIIGAYVRAACGLLQIRVLHWGWLWSILHWWLRLRSKLLLAADVRRDDGPSEFLKLSARQSAPLPLVGAMCARARL